MIIHIAYGGLFFPLCSFSIYLSEEFIICDWRSKLLFGWSLAVSACSLANFHTSTHTHTHTHLPVVRKWGKSVIKISRVVLKILIKKILGYIGTIWGNETCFSYGLVTMLVLLYSVFNLAAISLQKNHSLFHFFFLLLIYVLL